MPEPKAVEATRPSTPPPDQAERRRALDPARSFLVQAPAGSGKTYLLTQRFLRLLALVEKPDEIVAITFTKAAAAEMRHRILEALENAELAPTPGNDPESLASLAAKALEHSKTLGWQILDLPSQLRITTIDAFCRSLALESPLSWGLLSGLGGHLDPVDNPGDLYRLAARRTFGLLERADSPARQSLEALLRLRDNNWKEVEDLIVAMLKIRNRWYQEFVFARDGDSETLRRRLEAPFRRAARDKLETLCQMLDGLPECREYALNLARFACQNGGKSIPLTLAERAELPSSFVAKVDANEALLLEDAVEAYRDLANFLLTKDSTWRKKSGLNINHGFPSTEAGKAGKERFGDFLQSLAEEPNLESALAAFQKPMPVRYTDAEWQLVDHFFAVLRDAAGQLQVVFAESGSVDFTEVSQIALRILAPENGFPSDFAIRQADGIRHLLIDEFQDTSRSQHQLLAQLIAAWPEREGRSCFCVGDPMQSIYGFRDAEVELFERVKSRGLEIHHGLDAAPFLFDFVSLRANFRTAPSLVADLNCHFERIFAQDDGSGVSFSPAEAARELHSTAKTELHLAFARSGKPDANNPEAGDPETALQSQLDAIVTLIRSRLETANRTQNIANANPNSPAEKYRIAVLGKTRNSLIPIAEALRSAGIGFRAIDLVKLRERPEVLDALSLARALLNPTDRTAWLAVLRAPWCGLSLAELYLLTSDDDEAVTATPIPTLLEIRLPQLFAQGALDSQAFAAASRVERVLRSASANRSSASTSALGTWLESVWKALGGGHTVNEAQRENLRLLWAALDKLPDGELDLLGPRLNSALDDLYAQPDPAASSDIGVQLMTIHKSKGLEFEVVIVPDLQARGRISEQAMFSWLERGLADSESGDEDGQLTEFLIAPIQSKGGDPGAAKAWVDVVKRDREKQELRRVLYVAASRAREELHLFARPAFRIDPSSGEPKLATPTGLLATAWPAIGDEIEAQFAAWCSNIAAAQSPSLQLDTLAAQAGISANPGNLLQMPAPGQQNIRPTLVRRLPENYIAPEFPRNIASNVPDRSSSQPTNEESQTPYARTEGGLRSRLLGTAIHSLLEQLARLRRSLGPAESAQALAKSLPAIAASIRSRGLPRPLAERLAAEALAVAQQASTHPIGAWILTPHPHAGAEARWTALIAQAAASGPDRSWNLRPDRVFFAPGIADPSEPAPAEPAWWIIDYKTGDYKTSDARDEPQKRAFLTAHRRQHEDQLAVYAQALRSLRTPKDGPPIPIQVGIFYPRLLHLDSWDC